MRGMALCFQTGRIYTERIWRYTMNDSPPFLYLRQPCDEAVAWVFGQISSAGLKVVRTFDLLNARHAHANCPCPHHGTEQCDCQMVVLLVYGNGGLKTSGGDKSPDRQPVSLVAHGHNGQTWFSLVDTPQQRANPLLEAAIRQAVAQPGNIPMNLESSSHAT